MPTVVHPETCQTLAQHVARRVAEEPQAHDLPAFVRRVSAGWQVEQDIAEARERARRDWEEDQRVLRALLERAPGEWTWEYGK